MDYIQEWKWEDLHRQTLKQLNIIVYVQGLSQGKVTDIAKSSYGYVPGRVLVETREGNCSTENFLRLNCLTLLITQIITATFHSRQNYVKSSGSIQSFVLVCDTHYLKVFAKCQKISW